jgi:hypothetical protein
MYPRASDLTSKQVQSYSDQELFWIIQNGIRFTGCRLSVRSRPQIMFGIS